jgi:hypothetical protein
MSFGVTLHTTITVFTILILSPDAAAIQTYTDVTAQMGISVPGLGSGTAWGDFDADGDMDLLVSTSTNPKQVRLYRNDGSIFTDVTGSSGITGEARNFAVGDYDNDGLDDIAMISFGYLQTRLFRNLGNMQFQDVSAAAGIYGTYFWRAAWVDYNSDGMLDLFACGTTNHLFRNMGNGTFEECASSAGIPTGGKTCAWFDYDNDGREDCYIGRSGANLLYRNQGNGTFTEVAAAAGVNDPGGTSGVCAGDFDGDGLFDLYSVNINSPSNKLYRNLGNGTFTDVTVAAGVGDVGDGRTATFIDIDYDGLVDIFSSNHVHSNRLYRNNGNGTFSDVAPAMTLTSPPDPFGTGFADYDNDGDIDVFLATHFGNRLLRCEGVTNQWIRISLVGTVSNRSAIGAVVKCVSSGVTTYARVDGGHGMGDCDSRVVGLGLGDSVSPFVVTVYWPSGIVEVYDDLAAAAFVVLTEGEGTGAAGSVTAPVEGGLTLGVHPVPATGTFFIEPECPDGPVSNAIIDVSGRVVRRETVVNSEPFAVSGLPAGVYRVTASQGRFTTHAAMVILP